MARHDPQFMLGSWFVHMQPQTHYPDSMRALTSFPLGASNALPPGPSVSGGRHGADLSVICQCIEVAKTRHKDLSQLMAQQLESLQ